MIYPVVTSTPHAVHVDYKDAADEMGERECYFNRSELYYVGVSLDGLSVHIELASNTRFNVSFDGELETLRVASVDGVVPTDNADLAAKIAALML